MPTIHFPFGGSTADRTLNCPAWRVDTDKLPKIDRTSAAAERGTAMHDIMERCILENRRVDCVLEDIEHDFDEYDIAHLHAAERAIEQLFKQYGIKEVAAEILMQMGDDIGGSCDVIAAGDEWCLIADFKFGRIPVAAESNTQLLFYHMLACETPEVQDMVAGKKVVGAIIQPAVDYAPDVYEFDYAEVAAFKPRMLEAIEKARKGGTPQAGSHCAFCACEAYCAARKTQVKQALRISVEQSDSLAEALSLLPQLKSFLAACEDEAERILKEGLTIPGFKAVHKKTIRKWCEDKDYVVERLSEVLPADEIYTEPQIKSPAQISKLLKKDFDLTELLDQTEPGITFAPNSDKRPAVVIKDVANSKLSAILNPSK